MKDKIGALLTRNFILNPLFVVGIGRSGTSVLLRALGLHPLVFSSKGEAPLIRRFGALVEPLEFSDERDYYCESMNVSKEYLYDYLRRLCFEYVVGPHYGLDRITEELKRRDLSVLRKRRWCAKTFPTIEEYRGLTRLYPGIKLVYIVRNGLEVVHSRTRFHGFRDRDFESHCQTWVDSVDVFSYLANEDCAIQVRHEQLVTDPERLLRQVFDFADIGYHQAPVDFVRTTIMIPLDEPTQSSVDVRGVFDARKPPYENWAPEQRATFRRIAGAAMDSLGYEVPF